MKKLFLSLSLMCVMAFGFVSTASAELSAEATAGLTAITGSITDMEAGVWPLVAASVVALIGIKLFKRFSNKV